MFRFVFTLPVSRRTRCRAGTALLLLVLATGCVHQVNPRVTPEKLAVVDPPIDRRALLLLTPSFVDHVARQPSGLERIDYQMGTAASRALRDVVAGSFREAETRVVSDAEALRWLASPADSGDAEVVLVPRFESGTGGFDRFLDSGVEAGLRLDVRARRSGAVFSWLGQGRTVRVFSSLRGLSGSALEEALNALADSLRVHRERL